MLEPITYAVVIALSIAFILGYIRRSRHHSGQARAALERAIETGRTEPVSLHPEFDSNSCIATGACVRSCPEGNVIGLVNGMPELVNPSACIGHGACAAACPTEAISLVFGTRKRGVEIPHLKETFETNRGGIYIAGELGGMGLIRNAVTQGRQAVEFLAKSLEGRDPGVHDVIIVGAGPAGLSASLQAEKEGLDFVTVDQDDLGGTILSFPRQKVVMTQPMEVPLHGKFKFREIEKEPLLDFWRELIERTGIEIRSRERMLSIERQNGYFHVTTTKEQYAARKVLLAIGIRGTPRKLGVEGESSPKVAYKLIEPVQYVHKRSLVVGGGDSAVEAAVALSEQKGAEVKLSYRKNSFARIKEKNLRRLEEAKGRGGVELILESQVRAIEPAEVVIEKASREMRMPNDYVFVFIGGEAPTGLLRDLGVTVETKYGER